MGSAKSTLDEQDGNHEQSGFKRISKDEKNYVDGDIENVKNMEGTKGEVASSLKKKEGYEEKLQVKEDKITELEQVIADLMKRLETKDEEMKHEIASSASQLDENIKLVEEISR